MNPADGQSRKPRVAEFFAGIGLVRMALEEAGFEVVFANDVDAKKREMYALNFGGAEFALADIKSIRESDVPDVDLATASFPCTDLSLAGSRAGLRGRESGLVGEFLRVLREMGARRPAAVMIENVPGFGSSNAGADFRDTLVGLNELGYACDAALLDARRFVPQSRPRLFLIGALNPPSHPPPWNGGRDEFLASPLDRGEGEWAALAPSARPTLRPSWLSRVVGADGSLRMFSLPVPAPPEEAATSLDDVVEEFPSEDGVWWGRERLGAFLASLSPINTARAAALREDSGLTHATAYRRTRGGRSVWEIRGDRISGCLRTTRGGSSKQAVVEGGSGSLRVRWMTAREYARLQGAPDFDFGGATESQASFAMGDAVCVPVVRWLASHYLQPLMGRDVPASAAVTAHGGFAHIHVH